MKLQKNKKRIITFLLLTFIFGIKTIYAQDFGEIDDKISGWKEGITNIAKTLIGISAIVGAVWVYFKMQNDEGGAGKKALMTYLGGLAFAALVWIIIDAMLA